MFTAKTAGVEIPETAPKVEAANGNAHEAPAVEESAEPVAMVAEEVEAT